jgi:thimet oligopeptidase
MARSADVVTDFLQSSHKLMRAKFQAEQTLLTELEREDLGDPSAELAIEDIAYYSTMLLSRRYEVDQEVVRQYFAQDQVLRRIFDLFEELFSIEFTLVAPPQAWADEVQAAVVSDARTGDVLGAIYLDLHPRPGKYTHFASYTLVEGRALYDMRYQAPIAAIIGNWPEPSGDLPALWTLDQVSTMMHELGHALHTVLTTASYAQFAGTSVPRDFVEVPSQLLERWLESPEVLERLSAHHETGESMPRSLIDSILAARNATIGHFYTRQITYGFEDLSIHLYTDVEEVPDSPEDVYDETRALFATYYYPAPEETADIASFLHLFGGYDAGYYSYLWSDIIAADIASLFAASERGFLDTALGMRLREEIFEPGGARPENESIRAFLGRDWNADAFVAEIYGEGTSL